MLLTHQKHVQQPPACGLSVVLLHLLITRHLMRGSNSPKIRKSTSNHLPLYQASVDHEPLLGSDARLPGNIEGSG